MYFFCVDIETQKTYINVMTFKKNLLKLTIVASVFVLGASLTINSNVEPSRVVAEQHLDNFASYTYTGNYYDSIDFDATGGMNGDLRTSLTTKIRPEGFYVYSGSGTNRLSTQLQYADEDPTNDDNMVLFYSRDSITKTAATVDGVIQWNREHVWCKNLSNTNWSKDSGAEDEAGTDILHLRPTYSGINSARSDIPFGDINKSNPKYFDPDTKKVTNDSTKMLYAYSNGTYFEPLDSLKGDVARIIMYVWTTYTGYVGKKEYQPLNILSIFQSYDTLLRWHTQDRPDALEGHRNDYAQSSKQKNRNPFVDHPELAWRIFGDQASTDVKNACMQAYPYNVGTIDPTGITLNRTSASLEQGETIQLTASLEPNNATGNVSWQSNNVNVVTVSNNGLVTAVGPGNALITARVSQSIYTTCTISVTQSAYERVAAYDFSAGDAGTSEYTNSDNLLARFNNNALTGGTLSDIVTSVNSVSKVYAGYSSYLDYGLKFGTSSLTGSFTLNLNREVNKVVVNTAGWTATDSLTVGDADPQIPGEAYSEDDAIKTLTFNITSSDSVSFLYNKRGFIQSIDFYASREQTITPDTYINNATSYAKLFANELITPGANNTVTKTVSQLVGTPAPASGTQYASLALDSTITVSVNADGNNGKVYESGTQWRLYQSNNAVVTVSAFGGVTISSITFTFSVSNTGILKYGDNTVASDSPVTISSLTSAQFTVANSGSATNGQVRISSISVTYNGGSSLTVDNVSMTFGGTISKSDWDAINGLDGYQINDYGIMVFRTTEEHIDDVLTVEEYYNANPSNVAIVRKGSGTPGNEENGSYDFFARINFGSSTNYFNVIYCAAPFILVNDHYYFLPEQRYSVNSLANYYKTHDGCDLSSDALQYLSITH